MSATRFGPFRLDAAARVLWRGVDVVPLTPKAVELLQVLVESSGRVVAKEDLMARVWPDTFVEEANLSHHIYKLREALGEQEDGSKYIETLARRGYRFVAKVEVDDAAPAPVPDPPALPTAMAASQPWTWKVAAAGLVIVVAAAGLVLAMAKGRTASPAVPRAVAVLPFLALTPADHDEALELGMANAVITRLTNVPSLSVRPTSAVLPYSAPSRDPIAAGREQQVDAVVDGKIQRSDGRVRVTVQLLQVVDGRPIWAATFDQKADGVFAIQDAISEQIVQSLQRRFVEPQRDASSRHETPDMAAYDAYLRGVYYNSTWSGDGFVKGAQYLQEAVTRDPNFAQAWGALAFAYSELAFTDLSTEDARRKARAYAERAIALDNTVIQAHQALVNVGQYYEWDWAAAERECKVLLQIAPGDARSHQMYGWFLSLMGRFDEGLAEARRAQALDPRALDINAVVMMNRAWSRHPDEALIEAQRALELHPEARGRQNPWLGQLHVLAGRFPEAISAYEKSDVPDVIRLGYLGYAYARAGRRDDARRVLTDLQGRTVVPAFQIAGIHAGLGDIDGAMTWLEKAYDEHSPWMSWLLITAELDPVRNDPRFHALMHKVGFPEP